MKRKIISLALTLLMAAGAATGVMAADEGATGVMTPYAESAEKALALLNASAMQGNPYAAAVMKHRLDYQRTAIEIGVLRLWESVFRIFQNRLSDEEHRHNPIDRKQLRQINEKKLAQGLRPE